jgi:quaternary ammonium compound-resistance protein SugE
MAWVYLFIAGLLEIVWAAGLKYTEGFSKLLPSAMTVAAMIGSFWLLALALKSIPLGTGYAIWTGIGSVGAITFGIVVLGEPTTAGQLICLCLIIAGIVGLRLITPGH